jgi:hypothetical protein
MPELLAARRLPTARNSMQTKAELGTAPGMNLQATELDFQTTDEQQALDMKLDSIERTVATNLALLPLA